MASAGKTRNLHKKRKREVDQCPMPACLVWCLCFVPERSCGDGIPITSPHSNMQWLIGVGMPSAENSYQTIVLLTYRNWQHKLQASIFPSVFSLLFTIGNNICIQAIPDPAVDVGMQRKQAEPCQTSRHGNFKSGQCPGRCLRIIGRDPSVSKSHRFHVDIFQFASLELGYILQIPLKWWVILLNPWASTGSSSNSNGSPRPLNQADIQIRLVSGEMFGHNRSRSQCFQVQPVSCWHRSVSLIGIGVYSTDSSKIIGNFPESLSFNWFFLKLNQCFQVHRYHVDIFQFPSLKLGYILQIPLKWVVIFLNPWASTGSSSNSTGSPRPFNQADIVAKMDSEWIIARA